MREGLLPWAPVEKDVQTVEPPPEAQGCGGGFPCQALIGGLIVNFLFASTVIPQS